MDKSTCEVLIIGAGPAGLTTAIYSSRELHSTLVLEKAMAGGLPATTDLIENYPGFPEGISGQELMVKMKAQALRFGAELKEFAAVHSLERMPDGGFVVDIGSEKISAKTVVIASGSIPRILGIPGETELRGRGVSYCATCDGAFFSGMDVAVIGGGNSGLQEGEFLLKFAKSVTFIEFLPEITGSKIIQKRLLETGKVKFLPNHEVTRIGGENAVESITVKSRADGKTIELPVAGVFIYAGFLPNADFAKGLVELDEKGYIVTDERMRTSTPGLFAAGDIRSKTVRQVTTATSDGTIAAVEAGIFIDKK
ncbi:FAD-dependent oxidoreductase [bacterium]|nr:FAD-dependent oxidoreductase [bacterium]